MLTKALSGIGRYLHSTSDTIYALSSGVQTAISVVRVSGPHSYRVLELLKNKSTQQFGNAWQNYGIVPRHAHYKSIYNSQGGIIDQCILLYFPKEQSYNSQDIVELHLHGSRAVVAAVFKELKQKGMRMADKGQFTKRALINGKINLIQAESINDLIRSDSQFSRQVAVNNLLGKGIDFLQNIKKQLVRCLANIEAYIDFQEDQSDVKADLFEKNKQNIRDLQQSIQQTLNNYKNLQIVKQGINVVIAGRPNVGKSTLINGLARRDVAIVSEEAGTTRDILQTQIQCGGLLLNLFDTAGLRQSSNAIQMQGIKRAKDKIKQSQIQIIIVDLHQQQLIKHGEGLYQISLSEDFMNKSKSSLTSIKQQKNTILIINKADQLTPQERQAKYFIKMTTLSKKDESEEETEQVLSVEPQTLIFSDLIISASDPQGAQQVQQLLQKITQQRYRVYQNSQQIYFTRERYFDKLTNCQHYLNKYMAETRPDIAGQYLRNAITEVSELFGRTDCEDVLDVLFKEFCIGK